MYIPCARISVCLLVIGLLASTANAVNIETVTVGNPGNAGDNRWGGQYGAVAYTYNIGKYEVTAGQYTEFLNSVAGVDKYRLYSIGMSRTDYGSGISRSGGGTVDNPYTYSVASAFVNRPVNCVGWGDAARFANWLHNGQPRGCQDTSTTEDGSYALNGANTDEALASVMRKANATWAITSENEWYKAAYYKGGSVNAGYWLYPTSTDAIPGRDMDDASGNNANYYAGSGVWPIDSGMNTTIVGEFQNSDSPYGTFDQGGNVWEWNETLLYGTCRCVRGGSFNDFMDSTYLKASYPGSDPMTWESSKLGFRLVLVPEPTSIVFLALGAMSSLRRRAA